jgi:hypothetical protein
MTRCTVFPQGGAADSGALAVDGSCIMQGFDRCCLHATADVIVAIDDVHISGKSMDQVAALMRGDVGSNVVIDVLRKGQVCIFLSRLCLFFSGCQSDYFQCRFFDRISLSSTFTSISTLPFTPSRPLPQHVSPPSFSPSDSSGHLPANIDAHRVSMQESGTKASVLLTAYPFEYRQVFAALRSKH